MQYYENAAIKTLVQYWDEFNRTIFGESLKRPSLQLHEGRSRLGYWQSQFRIISLSRELLLEEPWYRVLAVLKHEMLHQFIEESMGAKQVPPHGELFSSMRQKFNIEEYEDLGFGQEKALNPSSAILEKIRKLLSLAQSDQLNEAQNAMRMANQLMLKWNIEQSQLKERRTYQIRQLGKPGRVMLVHKKLSAILRDYFFVEPIWVQSYDVLKCKRGRVLEVTGQRENVELSEYVYYYLLNLSEQLWKNHSREENVHKGNYLYGIMLGFYEKLEADSKRQQLEQALVWHGDPWLREFYERRHPRRGSLRSSKMSRHDKSLKAGKEDGKNIVIHKGLGHQAPRTSIKGQSIRGFLQ